MLQVREDLVEALPLFVRGDETKPLVIAKGQHLRQLVRKRSVIVREGPTAENEPVAIHPV